MDIHVDEYRSLVSVITMIFPSPDWFLGISNVDMCNPMTGEWREEYSRYLLPYDSGTDDGTSFESENARSNPRKNIFLIGNEDDTNFKSDSPIKPLGKFTFTRVPTKKCKGKAYYTLRFDAQWSNETHPSPVFPNTSMFSPLIGATHNKYYEMWRRGKMASPGVQQVAETGTNIIFENLDFLLNLILLLLLTDAPLYSYCAYLFCSIEALRTIRICSTYLK